MRFDEIDETLSDLTLCRDMLKEAHVQTLQRATKLLADIDGTPAAPRQLARLIPPAAPGPGLVSTAAGGVSSAADWIFRTLGKLAAAAAVAFAAFLYHGGSLPVPAVPAPPAAVVPPAPKPDIPKTAKPGADSGLTAVLVLPADMTPDQAALKPTNAAIGAVCRELGVAYAATVVGADEVSTPAWKMRLAEKGPPPCLFVVRRSDGRPVASDRVATEADVISLVRRAAEL